METRKEKKKEEREEKRRNRLFSFTRTRCSGERWHAGATSPVPGSFRQHFRLRCATTIGGRK